MAPQIKKAKTAFLFFQADQLSKIRKEKGLAMGEAMTEVSFSCLGDEDTTDGSTNDGISDLELTPSFNFCFISGVNNFLPISTHSLFLSFMSVIFVI